MHFRFFSIIGLLLLSACGSDSEEGSASGYSFNCANTGAYTPVNSPVIYNSLAGAASTTIIMIHGKSGSPLSSQYSSLYSDLQSAGYNVKALYMPWGNNGNSPGLWNGTLCQGMNYIDEVIQAEKTAGNNVVLIGHSMGGAGSFIYNSTADVNKPDASIIIAPGHFMHKSSKLQTFTAPSVATANAMVKAGNGDVYDTFDTYNNGALQPVTTTANIYLSYHDLSQYPDIVNNVLGVQSGPLYWIGGDADSLTTTYNYALLFSNIPTNTDNKYETITGTHSTVITNSTTNIITWLTGLGL